MKAVITIHSFVDVITNSSSELFCTVKGQKEAIEKIISDILRECECEAVELSVYEHEDYETGEIVPGVWNVDYDFEIKQAPCGMIRKKLQEAFSNIKFE